VLNVLLPKPTRSQAEWRNDDGATLVEVLVAIVISVVVGTVGLLFMLGSMDSTRRADGQNEQSATARAALDSWSILTRLAVDPVGDSTTTTPRFIQIGPTLAQFCVALETKNGSPNDQVLPIGVALQLDEEGQLTEDRWLTCTSMLAGDPVNSHRVVARGIARADADVWLFTPLAAADLPTGVSAGLVTSSLESDDSQLDLNTTDGVEKIKQISAVQLAFRTVPTAARPAPAGTYSTIVNLTRGS
jgi:type II secretory pathway pseudopilin PulG